MEFIQAEEKHAPEVLRIVETTIREVYPAYYTEEVVKFFLEQNDMEHILEDIRKGNTYLLCDEGRFVGTGTVERRHLKRGYVLPDSQNKGYGTAIMEFMEAKAAELFKDAVIETSLPGCIFHEKRGYKTIRHCSTPVENGKVLVYELMQKKLR